MRKEIVELEQFFEEQRIRHMAWWENSAKHREEREASREVMEAYEVLRGRLTPEARMLLEQVEEEWYLLKEAELQATYMQGISDGLDMNGSGGQKHRESAGHRCRRVS